LTYPNKAALPRLQKPFLKSIAYAPNKKSWDDKPRLSNADWQKYLDPGTIYLETILEMPQMKVQIADNENPQIHEPSEKAGYLR
jgi:hypothetical protein